MRFSLFIVDGMSKEEIRKAVSKVPFYRRSRSGENEIISRIGEGSLGGKASGLAFIRDFLFTNLNMENFPDFTINIPALVVIGTDFFDVFMRENNLFEIAYSDSPDERIAHAFQKGKLSLELSGDLRSLISLINSPLAIRSSSLLEDAMYEPFAGVYGTKMIPNNQPDIDSRFNMLVEAIKFVYSSVFFREAKAYIKATRKSIASEKMAVIIQEVVGQKHWERYYPHISGVARSYNFYPTGPARPEEGVVDLALGLGKTIVDGGTAWTYSPAFPKSVPPYNSIGDLLKQTQTRFWAVNMGKPPAYDPIRETEYMVQSELQVSEEDDTLKFLASTYIPSRDRISPGIGPDGPRLINFAPILGDTQIPLNNLIKKVLSVCQEAVGNPVEIEFAVTLDDKSGLPARFGLLQVRPMVVSEAEVEVSDEELISENTLVASKNIMGNGITDNICDVVFVKPDVFNTANSQKIAYEIENINRKLVNDGIPYLLIGFGRWGSSDPWLGIGVNWSQISGAKVIVESTLPNMNVELSQGSHFFHNISSFQICYFSIHHESKYPIKWQWFENQETIEEADFVKHVKLSQPLFVKVDGRTGKGVIKI